MAKDKITLVQFRKQIAAQTGFDENVVGAFLKQYFDVITEGLRSDAQVRIKDFGSFRIQTVEPRRSVDVRTGESIQLAGYNKVIFAASTILKEHVEAEEIISIAPPQSAANEEGEAGAAGEAGVAGDRFCRGIPAPACRNQTNGPKVY